MIEFEDFQKIDIRVGTITKANVNTKARKPAYVLNIDFGDPVGVKTSSAQITGNYTPEELVGRQIAAVVNFPVKNIAGVESEVLVLGAVSEKNNVILLEPEQQVKNGTRIG